MSRVRGKSGSKIVFSWTWKEKRKKDIEDVNNAYDSRGRNGGGLLSSLATPSSDVVLVLTVVVILSPVNASSLRIRITHPALSRPATPGKNPSAVNRADVLTSQLLPVSPSPASFRHLITTLLAHQKLATLSSNRPRENGNIRWMGWRMWRGDGARPGRKKGRKRMAKLATVVMARRVNRVNLRSLS
jgi:hypothetical protein